MYSLRIVLKKHHVKKDGTVPILLRVTKDKKKVYIRIGKYVNAEEWDFEKQEPKPRSKNANSIKNFINFSLNKADQLLIELERKPYSLADFKTLYLGKGSSSVYQLFEKVIDDKMKTSIGGANAYKTCYNVFKKYSNDVSFQDINYNFLTDYDTYLRSNNGCNNAGVAFHMRTLRALFNKAINLELVTPDLYPFKKYKIKKAKTKKVALNKDQLRIVKDFEGDEWENLARDLFMFSFYTQGMNMVDIYKLTKDNIIDGRIVYVRSKTGKTYSIKINSNIQSYFEKYKTKSKYLLSLDRFSNHKYITQKTNEKLKNIIEGVIFYSARHSWASIANESDINITVIKDALGHDDIKTTQVYLASLGNSRMDEANDIVGDI